MQPRWPEYHGIFRMLVAKRCSNNFIGESRMAFTMREDRNGNDTHCHIEHCPIDDRLVIADACASLQKKSVRIQVLYLRHQNKYRIEADIFSCDAPEIKWLFPSRADTMDGECII